MDFLCPNCQKMLTVPDQYAGTLMKCPLCANTFQAPALPSRAPAPAVVPSSPPPLPPPGNTYGLKEPPPVPPMAPPPAPNKVSTPPPKAPAPAKPPPPPPPSTGDYQHRFSLAVRPDILQWVPVGALIVVFAIQTIANMVGMYPGGYPAYTQGVPAAAFGWYNADPDWEKMPEANKAVPALKLTKPLSFDPSVLFYFFPLFPLALVLTIAAAVLPRLPMALPHPVERMKPYRWAIAAGATLVAFLFFSIPVLFVGFSLENAVKKEIHNLDAMKEHQAKASAGDRLVAMAEGSLLGAQCLERTTALRLSYLLLLLAVIVSGLMFWIEWREEKPPPRIDVQW
jgi:hypothetical protein